MNLESSIDDVKSFVAEQTTEYKASPKNAVKNGLKAAAGIALALYFDNNMLEIICGAYGALKAFQFAQDFKLYREEK